jgi:two-component system sensor histidine kinase RstB
VTGPAPHRSSSGTWRSGRGELRQIAQFRSFQQRQGARFLASLVLSAIIILLAALLVVWPLIRKLRLQEQTIHAIAEGDLDAHAPEGGDALGKLGTRLNQMTRRIKELLADQRQLIHAVSHEMRTPTARLGFGLEMLEVLRAKVEPFGPEIEIHTRSIPPGARVTANEHHFSRAVENLMRNAIRHANSKVIIRFATSGSTTSLHIDDDGSGIPVGDRLRIFDAIYPPRFVARSQDRRDGIGPRHLAPYL